MNGERARVLNYADEKLKQVNSCRAEFTSKIRELSKMYVYTLSCYNEYYGIQRISDMQSYTSQVY